MAKTPLFGVMPVPAFPVPPFTCPVCGGQFQPQRILDTETTSGGVVAVQACPTCGVCVTYPRRESPQQAYQATTLETFSARYARELRGERPPAREPNYVEEVAVLQAYTPSGAVILDVGCNVGWLLGYALRNAHFSRVEGLEPAVTLADIAHQRLGVVVHTAYLHEMTGEGLYDGIISTDVIEHVLPESQREFLGAAYRLLKHGGVLVLKTPNVRYLRFKAALAKWLPSELVGRVVKHHDLWDAKEHVIYYDVTTLTAILRACGFEVIHTRTPLPVDSYGTPALGRALRRLLYLTRVFRSHGATTQDLLVVARKP